MAAYCCLCISTVSNVPKYEVFCQCGNVLAFNQVFGSIHGEINVFLDPFLVIIFKSCKLVDLSKKKPETTLRILSLGSGMPL